MRAKRFSPHFTKHRPESISTNFTSVFDTVRKQAVKFVTFPRSVTVCKAIFGSCRESPSEQPKASRRHNTLLINSLSTAQQSAANGFVNRYTRMFMKSRLYFIAMLVLFPAILSAQFSTGNKVGFSWKGGFASNYVDIEDRNLGTNWAFSADYWMVDLYSIGLELGTATINGKGSRIGISSNIWYLMANIKLKLIRDGIIQPYLITGLEQERLSPKDSDGRDIVINRAINYDQYKVGIPLGIGSSYFLKRDLSADFQTIYRFSAINYAESVGQPGDGDDDYLTSNLGLTFYFGDEQGDRDGDGIPDVIDICPDDPEDRDGFDDDDGCPDYDNDEDGIRDVLDACPNEPEDFDNFQDEDGCPDPDNDGDGIWDRRDRCPGTDKTVRDNIDTKEDYDGFEDTDGCPDLDNDGDGIPDVADACPNVPENFNGVEDNDGCPDSNFQRRIVLNNIYFKFNSAELDPNSELILNYIAEALIAEDSVRVEISGHTDNIGSDSYNLNLSQRRAESVRRYLISQGISEFRIIATGKGESEPVASNATETGRSRNRRIEIERIQ